MIRLAAVSNVEAAASGYIAMDRNPWLAIEPISVFAPGKWFRMRYRLGLYDHPARPLVSYRRNAEEIGWHLLPGAVLGCAEWCATVPRDATAVWVSPVCDPGPFHFAIEEIQPLSFFGLLRRGLAGDRARLAAAIGTWLLGWPEEAQENMQWAIQGTALTLWPSYQDKLSAAASLEGFEKPRCDWTRASTIRLVAFLEHDTAPEQIGETIVSLQAQLYPRWTLTVIGAPKSGEAGRTLRSWLAKDARLTGPAEALKIEGDDSGFVGFVQFGDRLAPHALACFIEASERYPDAAVLFCDEETGPLADPIPVFKPDWSFHFHAERPYVGRLMLTRLHHVHCRSLHEMSLTSEALFVENVLRDLDRRGVRHIRRLLVRTRRSGCEAKRVTRTQPAGGSPPVPAVTIVMVTRDRAEFLRRAVASVLEKTRFVRLDLVIVDNGSTDPTARAVLSQAAQDPRVTLLYAPGPFNFAALSNLGAAKARGEVVVFLNNDIEVIDPGWVSELAFWAVNPKIGAVGCKLFYPDGRVQHAGIVAGIGDAAGHFDAGLSDKAQGWLGRNHAVHEASAVTGACLAVERTKFEAVGGFDAIHLPVEFGDIDLCFRLEERGFTTLWTPAARVVHYESASRGRARFRRLSVHAAERAYFRQRWAERLRDDPFFHPGLSLYRLSAALA